MNLSDLPSREIARIDAICSDYETSYRLGNSPAIEDLVSQYGGQHAELLRHELELVRKELQTDATVAVGEEAAARPASPVPELPQPGTELGPYLIGETIGRGGMGVVLSAIDQRLKRRVAIKMLSGRVAHQVELAQRFDREARAVAAISHPNIVELFDVGMYRGLPYAVMEFLDGELLSERLSRAPLTAAATRDLGAQIADALSCAHQEGVIHRDLKPQNVMLTRARDGAEADTEESAPRLVKLIDFGLSRAPRSDPQGEIDATEQGVILGTPGYMAPEQALGQPATEAADIFALGCILFEAFYGKRAFEGTGQANRHHATLGGAPDPDPALRQRDPELAALIEQCLSRDPAQRPRSAAAIARTLRRQPPPDRGQDREGSLPAGRFTRRRLWELTAGGVAAALGAAFYASARANPLAQIDSIAVLSFSDPATHGNPSSRGTLVPPAAVGGADLTAGEEFAAMLVHELSRLPRIVVPPFRPLSASSPRQYRQVAELLEVEALLTGSLRTEIVGEQVFQIVNLSIVSAADGSQLWGDIIRAEASESFLQQSELASSIARKIGQRLTASVRIDESPESGSFRCLVDGRVRCDPDSRAGLEMALKCFQRAHQADVRFAAPLAGIALTSLLLAAQSDTDQAVSLIQRARDAAHDALQRSPGSVGARLASAMLDWQTTEQYALAAQTLVSLIDEAPNQWQVHHQYGLLQLAQGSTMGAIESLRRAALLNPLSITVKTDLARAYWYDGDIDRACEDAQQVHDRYGAHPLARGLLIDIHEQRGDFDGAAAYHASWPTSGHGTPETYFHRRRGQLGELPYGPFGAELNQAIWDSRAGGTLDRRRLADLLDRRSPMLALVLARHPGFQQARTLPRAQEMLQRLSAR